MKAIKVIWLQKFLTNTLLKHCCTFWIVLAICVSGQIVQFCIRTDREQFNKRVWKTIRKCAERMGISATFSLLETWSTRKETEGTWLRGSGNTPNFLRGAGIELRTLHLSSGQALCHLS